MILDLAEPHFGGPEKMATVLFENVALHAQPIILAAKPGDLCRRVGGGKQGRGCAPILRPVISSSAAITPVAKHRGCDAQLPCDLRQRPTAARQQGNRLPLELIRKLTTALAHWTPSRSPRSLAKVSTNSGEAQFCRAQRAGRGDGVLAGLSRRAGADCSALRGHARPLRR